MLSTAKPIVMPQSIPIDNQLSYEDKRSLSSSVSDNSKEFFPHIPFLIGSYEKKSKTDKRIFPTSAHPYIKQRQA